jgi:dienelactone hydrolase
VILLLVIMSPTHTFASEDLQAIDAVQKLWAGYDPRAEPLEIEVVKTWDEDLIRIEELRFTGETWEGKNVRAFAYRGAPRQGENLPGVLHLHGGGQTASLDWVRFWTRRGYVSVSHDFCGKHPQRTADKVTDWAAAPAYMAMPTVPTSKVRPTPRYSAWYHWILLGRRAITLLQQHALVDPERIGVFGISVGGTLTWMVAGVDPRVKAAVPIYGVGQNTYTFPWQTPEDPVSEETRIFRKTLAPEAYAPHVKCPLLFMNGSNDHHGRLDLGMRTLALATKTPMLREIYSPGDIHHIEPPEARDLPLWMDYFLKGEGPAWPESPGIKVEGGGKSPTITVTVDRPDEVDEIKVYYGLNNPWPTSRFYRVVVPQKVAGADYSGPAPILNADDVIYTFANVAYRSGIRLSTRLIKVDAKNLSGVQPALERTLLIDPMDDHAAWFWWLAGTDPVNQQDLFKAWTGLNGEQGFTHVPDSSFSFATTALGDPQWTSAGTHALIIDVWADALPETLEVSVSTTFFQPGQVSYKYRPTFGEPKAAWIILRLNPNDFKDDKGNALASWKNCDFICFSGKSGPGKHAVFKNLRWEKID